MNKIYIAFNGGRSVEFKYETFKEEPECLRFYNILSETGLFNRNTERHKEVCVYKDKINFYCFDDESHISSMSSFDSDE